jgi:uracil-DNA glycosylase
MAESDGRLQLEESWARVLSPEFDQPYMAELKQFLVEEKAAGRIIYPAGSLIFNALNSTPLENVKVVILGQDPYHGPGQAHGLSFSVLPGIPLPPSLRNIFKEVHDDLGLPMPDHGCLQPWADQGVLLLNATLTVERGKAGSHQGHGWEGFTNRVIEVVNSHRSGVVFMLWGSFAQQKAELVDPQKHCVLSAPHPSPFSARRGFFGCRHFSKANHWLQEQGATPINWALPPLSQLQH